MCVAVGMCVDACLSVCGCMCVCDHVCVLRSSSFRSNSYHQPIKYIRISPTTRKHGGDMAGSPRALELLNQYGEVCFLESPRKK